MNTQLDSSSGHTQTSTFQQLLRRMGDFFFCLLSLPAYATTQAEDERTEAPMPHESSRPQGGTVKAHLVSAHGYLEGQPDNAARLAQIHAEVEQCVKRNSATGAASRPPRLWPGHVNSYRMDTYSTVNRTISYTVSLAYSVNPIDCSLIETKNSIARLSSRKGTCEIDMVEKKAHGTCDASGHANAQSPVRRPYPTAAQIATIRQAAAHNPAMAALADAMRKHPAASTGERKTIAGLECDVWPNPLAPEGTTCLSRGGSFSASNITGDEKSSGMTLEIISTAGNKMRATRAQLDTVVNAGVFAPYLAGGFRITNTGARP